MFPDFLNASSDLIYLTKMKRCILMTCALYSGDEIEEKDIKELRTEKNWFYTKDKSKSNKELSIETEKNFLHLIQFLELSLDTPVIIFYSKLDYINKQNGRDKDSV